VAKKLYVGNLSYQVSSADLEQMFSQYGEVQSAQVVMDRESGRSRGFGFVEMSHDADAAEAIAGLHDQDSGGRRLVVNEAKPREARTTTYGRSSGGGGDRGGRGPSSYGGRRY